MQEFVEDCKKNVRNSKANQITDENVLEKLKILATSEKKLIKLYAVVDLTH